MVEAPIALRDSGQPGGGPRCCDKLRSPIFRRGIYSFRGTSLSLALHPRGRLATPGSPRLTVFDFRGLCGLKPMSQLISELVQIFKRLLKGLALHRSEWTEAPRLQVCSFSEFFASIKDRRVPSAARGVLAEIGQGKLSLII